VDTLVGLHARFWDQLPIEGLDLDAPAPAVTQSAQAWPPEVIAVHAAAARRAVASFVDAASAQITPSERALLDELVEAWEGRFLARVAGGRAITLIHADFHVLGNVLFAAGDPRPRVIDWSEAKPGLGPHDLAYCLVGVACRDRPARDRALVRRYWDGLRTAGIEGYGWELCWWDYRFSVCTNLFQAMFQGSVMWFRETAAVVAALGCRAALHGPPPLP
jgi:aminoglycoside phosphotransferase (APT) family kinase protein